MSDEKLMTTSEAAEFLQMHPFTVTQMARNQEIPAVKIGRTWRFSRQRLEQMFTEKKEVLAVVEKVA